MKTPAMKTPWVALFAVTILSVTTLSVAMLPGSASADVSVRTSSFVRGFARPGVTDTSQHVPFLQFVDLAARDLGDVRGLSLHTSLWGQIEFVDIFADEERATGDVGLLFVEYRAPEKSLLTGLQLRLGRQFVAAGPAVMEQLDGGFADYRLPLGVSFTAFGGVPTGIRFVRQPWTIGADDDRYSKNWVIGGRVGYAYKHWAALGVSYRQKRLQTRLAHNDLGWDLNLQPLHRLFVLTDGALDLEAQRLRDARGSLRFEVAHDLDLSASYRFTSPDLYVPRSSIFAVFSNEQHQEFLGEVYWAPLRWLSVELEAGGLIYGETCTNGDIGGVECEASKAVPKASLRTDLRLGAERRHRFVIEGELVRGEHDGFVRWRGGYSGPVWCKLAAIVEAEGFWRDEDEALVLRTTDVRGSFAGSAYLTYPLPYNLDLMAGGQVMITPLLKNAGGFTVRLNWAWDTKERGRR